jgi:hypothetical protein
VEIRDLRLMKRNGKEAGSLVAGLKQKGTACCMIAAYDPDKMSFMGQGMSLPAGDGFSHYSG